LEKKKLIKGQLMQRIILLVVCSVFLPFHALASEIENNNFEDGIWGSISHGTFWTLQNTGGVNNSKAIRLEYSEPGTAGKAASVNLAPSKSQEFWIEMDVKMEGTPSGGSKFIKFFGSSTTATQNNMTLVLNYWSNKQNDVQYHYDSNCIATYSGTFGGDCSTPTFNYSSGSSIDMSGGSWGHYKLYIKRADPGMNNGALKVWWNNTLKVDISKMASNALGQSTDYVAYVEFGGYNHADAYSGKTWYLWMDNIYVGTTEKNGDNVVALPLSPNDLKMN
jgi:hypothetical protein